MIGFDTNVLLRLVLRDNEIQYAKALSFVSNAITRDNPAFINVIVLVEFVWTLRRIYKLSPTETLSAVAKLIDTPSFLFERHDLVLIALHSCRDGAIDLADALIAAINREEGCTGTVTFDGDFVRSGEASAVP